jgi:hypothetical protein
LRIRSDRRRRFGGENGLLHVADCNWKSKLHNCVAKTSLISIEIAG